MASAMAQLLSIRLPPCIPLRLHRHFPLSSTPFATHLNHHTPTPSRCATLRTSASSSDTPLPPPATVDAWRPHWRALLQRLHAWGHFSGDPHIGPDDVEEDGAAAKRAVLSFSRQRPDVLTALPAAKVSALVRAGLPGDAASDRKARNAYKRLEASFIKWQPLSPGDGGPADLQDVLRMVLALSVVPEYEIERNEPVAALAVAAGDLLPDVLAAAEAPPPPGAPQLSEKAKNMQRLAKGGRGRGEGDAGRGGGRGGGRKPHRTDTPWSRSKF